MSVRSTITDAHTKLDLPLRNIELSSEFRGFLEKFEKETVGEALELVDLFIDRERLLLWAMGSGLCKGLDSLVVDTSRGPLAFRHHPGVPENYAPLMAVDCFSLRDILLSAIAPPARGDSD